ncbi:MAG: hypothetical protein WCP04_12025 [Pseudomonadota bacterium]
MTKQMPASDVRARNRRLTLALFLLAAGVYAAFIAMSIWRAKG